MVARTLIALVVVAVWVLSAASNVPRRILPASAPASRFSAQRAEQILARLLGPERPHPVSSLENAAVRARLLREFAALGIRAQVYQAFACNAERGFADIACATVNDVVAEVMPGAGPAVVMMAHYDSVPAGPGAADNMSGVATVLEAARALRASGIQPRHPVLALITDGEEAGMLGAQAFLQNLTLRARVGAVVNVDARGSSGPSLLFQTSAANGKLIDLYVHSVPAPATSSLYQEIYQQLPNDTDLTPFLQAGFRCFNFAFIGDFRYYHSPFDQRGNLSEATLQMHGDNMLGVVRTLSQTGYDRLNGADAIYLSVLNRIVPRMPASAALPRAIVVWAALALAAWLQPRRGGDMGACARAAFTPPALILGCALSGLVLAGIARMVSGTPDPSYAHPIALRLALAFGVWAVTLVVARWTDARAAAASGWLWMGGFGVLAAALLPGLSPYFVFPSLIAAVVLLASALAPGGWLSLWGRAALLISALAALLVWCGLVTTGESIMGLRLHPLFTLPAALALLGVLPLLASSYAAESRSARYRASLAGAAACGMLALAAAVTAGLLPAFSAASPERVNLIYFENQRAAQWIADTGFGGGEPAAPLPRSLLKAGGFRLAPLSSPLLGHGPGYVAAAGVGRLPLPTATLTQALGEGASGAEHAAVLHLRGSEDADGMMLFIARGARLHSIELRGQHLHAPAGWRGDTRLVCVSRDCRDEVVTLGWAGPPLELEFAEERYGLPAFGAPLAQARPHSAMPSQDGDQAILAGSARLP